MLTSVTDYTDSPQVKELFVYLRQLFLQQSSVTTSFPPVKQRYGSEVPFYYYTANGPPPYTKGNIFHIKCILFITFSYKNITNHSF